MESKIAELQGKLEKLGEDSKRYAEFVRKGEQCRAALLELSPEPYQQESNHLRAAVNEQFVQEISWCERRLALTDEIQKRGPAEEWSIRHARTLPDGHTCRLIEFSPEGFEVGGSKMTHYRIDDSAWNSYKSELLSNRAEVEAQLSKLKERYQKALDEAKGPLRYYERKFDL